MNNEIRQILMNEMGLTRESIREEMDLIIASTIEKHFNKLINDKTLDELINSHIARYLDKKEHTLFKQIGIQIANRITLNKDEHLLGDLNL